MKNLFRPFLILFSVLIIISCKKEDVEVIDEAEVKEAEVKIIPKEAILGKWELKKKGTSMQHLIEVPAVGYTEYINDKSYRFYDYKDATYTYGDYSLNDSMLIFYQYAVENNTIDTVRERYYHTFKDFKTLLLERVGGGIFNSIVCEKVK